MGGTLKKHAGFVLMKLDADDRLDEYPAPSGRKYKFENDACEEWVHPMDVNYLDWVYGIKRVGWKGVEE